jgi:hypothetical protein
MRCWIAPAATAVEWAVAAAFSLAGRSASPLGLNPAARRLCVVSSAPVRSPAAPRRRRASPKRPRAEESPATAAKLPRSLRIHASAARSPSSRAASRARSRVLTRSDQRYNKSRPALAARRTRRASRARPELMRRSARSTAVASCRAAASGSVGAPWASRTTSASSFSMRLVASSSCSTAASACLRPPRRCSVRACSSAFASALA